MGNLNLIIALPRALLSIALAAVACAAQANTGTLAVSAVVLSKNNCKFANGAAALDFLALDPGATANQTATATINFTCKGSDATAVFAVSGDNGLYSSDGVRRMRNTVDTSQFVGYSLQLSPASGTAPKNVVQTLTITGTVAPAQVGDAIAGSYSDTVSITVTP